MMLYLGNDVVCIWLSYGQLHFLSQPHLIRQLKTHIIYTTSNKHNYSHQQIRLLFNRKNKTLRSVLLTKPTIKMLDTNRRTQKSLNDNNNEQDNNMEEEEKGAEQIIEEVVELERWKGKRASKLDLDDFLALLAEFNKRGIHFA